MGTDGVTLASTSGASAAGDRPVTMPLAVGGEPLGELVLSPRGPGEQYSSTDRRLVRALTPQVALAVRLMDLASALERQRDRVLAARREERDRLRQDLHDGLGPSMTGIAL